ncbi:UvrD-helicase domain-containing protein [bacterium]|nr:UvrD-helicase domain-containing protein [bacterium]
MTEERLPYLKHLNEAQVNAVTAVEGPVLVLAGAGSGKTRVLTTRITYMIDHLGIDPSAILAMTFTNKAAREMRTRVESSISSADRIWIGTFHSVFARILRYEAGSFGYESNFVIYDADDQLRLIKSIMSDFGISVQLYQPRAIAALISGAKNQLVTPDSFMRQADTPVKDITAKIYPEYENRLRMSQAFDFDDLITVPIELFDRDAAVLQKYRHRFSYLLVDEYQDTNRAQYMLLKRLTGGNRNIFAVGDDDQSIYRWRGADIRNILEFEKDFPDAQVHRLEQNYRSTEQILAAANSVVANNSGRKGKTLWTAGERGEPVEVIEVENERMEAQKIVDTIHRQVLQRKRSFSDFVILYRTNAQSRAIEEGLRRNGLAYTIVGGMRFYERKEIKDILAYLKVISNPRDTISLKRIINFPLRGIGAQSISKLEQFAASGSSSLFEAAEEVDDIPDMSERMKKSIRGFYDFIAKYVQLKDKISLSELIRTLVDEAGLLLMYKEDTSIEGQGKAENVRELLAAVDDYAAQHDDCTLAGFLEEVSLVSDVDLWNDGTNVITLMTLHCAKGLEFPVVFIAGLEDGLFPGYRSLDDPVAMEEERRLMYVGMTRAMERLYLFHARSRRLYNDTRPSMPSRFIDEIDNACVLRQSMGTRDAQRSFSGGTGSDRIRPARNAGVHPDYESFSQEQFSIEKGMWISHQKYGRGCIAKVSGKGPKQVVHVQFESGGIKKFIAQYAKFDIIG